MADMLTMNTRKPVGNEAPAKSGRGRNAAPMPVQSIGPLLRERREAMGVTLAESEVATRIRQKYLAALESDEWDLLPGEVVGRGFLRNYATYLGLEPTEMIERRRAVADESLAAVLVNTSAGAALPPERKVDYRPKDVALKDEGDELEPRRRMNPAPLLAVLALLAVAALVWWAVAQLGPQMDDFVAAAEDQMAALTQPPAVQPTPTLAATPPSNLVAGNEAGAATGAAATGTDAAAATGTDPSAAPADASRSTDTGVAAAPVTAATEAVAPTAIPTVATEAAQPVETAAPSLFAAITPTPLPAEPTPVPQPTPAPATVTEGANVRSGPGTDFPVVSSVPQGNSITITGRNADGTWYQVDGANWVFAQLVANPPANVPVVEAPAAPPPAAEAAPAEAAPAQP